MKRHEVEHATYKSYALGFALSLLLTLVAYFLVQLQILSGMVLLSLLMFIGLLQAVAQFTLFLHVEKEHKPRWNLLVFAFMIMVILIVVLGSLWIMWNLNYNMMPEM